MNRSLFFNKKMLLLLVSIVLFLFCAPAQAYFFGDNWSTDGYIKSQFGLFTEGKPFNKAEYGGSNDNIATARQQFRWNLNGQLTNTIGIKAEVLAAWEPEYPHEKGTEQGGQGHLPANYYSSFDWRELTIEYKPSYAHTIRFGRQIINWGEAISGRVVDQLNPSDSRYLLGFTNLEETYMPLWLFRGIHDFYQWNTSIEWIAAPIWQADKYEHGRRMTATGLRYGDDSGKYGGEPWYRFAANPEGRVRRLGGADMSVYATDGSFDPYKILGPPFDALYGTPFPSAALSARYPGKTSFIYINKAPLYEYDYTDHNFKNTRWGIKTKHMLWGAEVGLSFYQGPAHSGTYHLKADYGTALLYDYIIPRYNTYGLFGNYQFPWAIVLFEGAYKPKREFHKQLYYLTPAERLAEPVEEVDLIHTLLGITREQTASFINKYNPITIRAQWQAVWYLEDTDGLAETTSYFNEPPQVNHEFLLSLSTYYSYRKYSPGLTFVVNPRGQLYSSASITVVPDGFNSRLSVSAGYTNIWGANAYSTSTVYAAKNDLAVLTVKYDFY